VFHNVVPINNIYIVFLHEEDKSNHLVFEFKTGDEGAPIGSTIQKILGLAKTIPQDTKPGVYALDNINFEACSGNTLDYQGNVGAPKFEVIPERQIAPQVQDLSIFTEPREWW
jgi:hypothetical protein